MRPKRSTAAQDRRLGIGVAGDIQLDGQQVARLSQGVGHAVGVPTRGHNRVAGRQGRLGELDTHPAAGAGDEPHLLVTHLISLFCAIYFPKRSMRYAISGPSSPSYASCAIARENGSRYLAIRSGPASTGSNPTSRISLAATSFPSWSSPQ